MINELRRNSHDLFRCFASPKNHFRKSTSQTSMRVELRESKVNDGCRLKRLKHLIASERAGSESLKQFDRLCRGHGAQSATSYCLGHAGKRTVLVVVRMMMMKEPLLVLKEIPYNTDIDYQDDQHQFGEPMDQFVYLYRNEE